MIRRLGVSDDPTVAAPTLHDCIEAVLEQSGPLMDDVLSGLSTAVDQASGKTAKVNSRVLTKQIVDALTRQGAAVRDTFSVQLRLAIYRSGAHVTDPQALVRFDDIQLLDQSQLDANIEYAMAQQEIQFVVDDLLPPVNALISSLMGWLSVQAHLNPLRPETFARALRETLLRHVPSEQARNALIGPAGGNLGNSLRRLYKELVDWLRSQGVEPVVPLLTANAPAPGSAPVESPVSRTMLTLDKLRRLLTGELDGGEPPKDFLHTVPAPVVALEDLKMVEPMMKRLSDRAKQAPLASARADHDKDQNRNRKLGQQLGEEVVRLMMDNLRQDARLLAPVRAQVKELEPLLLKLAKADPRFFSDRRHPARQFLDRITHQSLGYRTENDERFQRFLKMVSSSVLELLGSDGGPESFARALTMLDAQWSRVDMELKARQEEAARALMHAEQRNLLAQRLVSEFQELMVDKKIPEFVAGFLCGPWAQVVAESQLRGRGNGDTEEYLSLVDDLLWSVQVKLVRQNRARLVKVVPNLLVKLRHGLQLIEYPPERIPKFFDELIAQHEKAFEAPKRSAPKLQGHKEEPSLDEQASVSVDAPSSGPMPLPEELGGPVVGLEVTELSEMPEELPEEFSQEHTEGSEFGVLTTSSSENIWVGGQEASEAGYLPEAELVPEASGGAGTPALPGVSPADLAIGSWVELQLKGEWVRAQLTWASPHRTLFMFISGKGLAHSMSRRTMEQLRTNGMLRVVTERHVVDNALDAVAQAALLNARNESKK